MRRAKILITGHLPDQFVTGLSREFDVEMHPHDRPMAREALLRAVADKDGLLSMITDAVDRELLNRAPRLRMIANFGVGYNNIDVKEACARRIPVSNTPGVLTDATADLAFALILGAARRLVEGDRLIRQNSFPPWAPFHFLGTEVSGKVLGIIGMGRIGKALARRAKGFGMPVLYYSRNRIDPAEEKALGAGYADMTSLLGRADFVSLHVALTGETRHLIGAAELSLMKKGSFLINTCRGPVVDEKALVSALNEKLIAGAALDVYENEPLLAPGLADLEQVVLLPHIGSATRETRMKMAETAVRNLTAGMKGERPPNLVNAEVWP